MRLTMQPVLGVLLEPNDALQLLQKCSVKDVIPSFTGIRDICTICSYLIHLSPSQRGSHDYQ